MKRVNLRILPIVMASVILGLAVQARAFLLQGANTNAIIVPAFYVATNGNDSDLGTLSQPFATIAKAQMAMRASSTIKKTYIRAGSYSPAAVTHNGLTYALYLTSADNGETWSFYPPDGYNTAILDGGSTSSSTGIQNMIAIEGGSNITINGLQVQHFAWNGISVHGGSNFYSAYPTTEETASGNVITNNIVHDGWGAFVTYDAGGITAQILTPNTTITNNVVYNQNGQGIVVGNNGGAGNNYNGLLIANNVIYNVNTDTSHQDYGAIYLQDYNASSTATIKNNFIRDYGIATGGYYGIYLDDGASNTTVEGNIITGKGFAGMQIHGGKNNNIISNIMDLGPNGNQVVMTYAPDGFTDMSGTSFISNIIIFDVNHITFTPYFTGNDPNSYVFSLAKVSNNVYYNYSTGGINYSCSGYTQYGCMTDSDPVAEDPSMSGWTYKIAGSSPVYNSPVKFAPIAGNWGPPGYVIPQTGSPPSLPQ